MLCADMAADYRDLKNGQCRACTCVLYATAAVDPWTWYLGGVSKSMLTLNEAIIDVKKG